jgi:hypothetical protein
MSGWQRERQLCQQLGLPTASVHAVGKSKLLAKLGFFAYTLILLWFYLFIMINLAYVSSVRIVLTLVALICNLSFLHILNLVAQFIMIYILVLIWKLPNIPTPPKTLVLY